MPRLRSAPPIPTFHRGSGMNRASTPSVIFWRSNRRRFRIKKANAATSNGWASRLNRRLQKVRPALGPLGVVYDELYFEYCQRVTPVADSLDALRRFPAADVIVDHA